MRHQREHGGGGGVTESKCQHVANILAITNHTPVCPLPDRLPISDVRHRHTGSYDFWIVRLVAIGPWCDRQCLLRSPAVVAYRERSVGEGCLYCTVAYIETGRFLENY